LLQSGTNTVKVAKEQARQAYGFESWNPDPANLQALRTAFENIKASMFEDETLPVQQDPYLELGDDDHLREVEPDQLPPIFTPTPEPAVQVVPLHQQSEPQPQQTGPSSLPQIQLNQATASTQQQNITIEVSSPTYNQQDIHLQQQHKTFGMTTDQLRRPAVRTPVRRAPRSRTPTRGAQATSTTPLPPTDNQQLPQGTTTPQLPPLEHSPAEQPPAINVPDDSSQGVGDQAPQTPDALTQPASTPMAATSSAPSRLTPAKRPGEQLADATCNRVLEAAETTQGQQTEQQQQPAEMSHSALANKHVTARHSYDTQPANTVVRIQQQQSPISTITVSPHRGTSTYDHQR
jgi:hypothetical protein